MDGIFVEGNTKGEDKGDQQNDDDRVCKFLQELLPKRFALHSSEGVFAILLTAFNNLGISKPFVVMFFRHKKYIIYQGANILFLSELGGMFRFIIFFKKKIER